MKVHTLTGKVLEIPGGTISYCPNGYFDVDDALALEWIKTRVAEDPTGQVTRRDLLTYEEAVAAGECDPDKVTPEQFAASQRPVVDGPVAPPLPPFDPWAPGTVWLLRQGKTPVEQGYVAVRIVSAGPTVTVTTLGGESADELICDRQDFVSRYLPQEA